MPTPDAFAAYYADLIEDSYDCVDRLVVFRLVFTKGAGHSRASKLVDRPTHIGNPRFPRSGTLFNPLPSHMV